MKSNLKLLAILFVLTSCSPSKKLTYNNRPVINAKSTWTAYQVGSEWYKGYWSVAPQVKHDTLQIVCYGSKESFKFKTHSDSIAFL